MSAPHPRLARLLPGILGPWLACAVAHAQIHEEKPAPGLKEGLLFHREAKPETSVSKQPQRLSDPQTGDISTQDFSVCFMVPANVPAAAQSFAKCSLSKTSGNAGWSVSTGDVVAVNLRNPALKDPITMSAPSVGKGEGLHHIAVVIKRDARQPLSGIWIDGVEQVSAAVPPVSLSCPNNPLMLGESDGIHSIHDVRIYGRALTRAEILDLMWSPSGLAPKPKHPAPPPDGPRFIPQPDETIVLIGGTEAVALAESGELEALLLMAFPQTRFHFRSLAWEGDTVFKQDRPMNFGSLEQQLRRVNAGAVFMMFGRQECLEGKDEGGRMKDEKIRPAASPSLQSFKTAFEKLLSTVAKVTPNIVVIGPVPFEKKPPPLPDLAEMNIRLIKFSNAMREISYEKEVEFSDTHPLSSDLRWRGDQGTTKDGVQLTSGGLVSAAFCIGLGLSLRVESENGPLAARERFGKAISPLLPLVQSKNRLWHDYWRPSNWAFLHGDRTNQPSSRDPVNPQVRFFPAEQEKYLPLIKDAEEKVFQLVEEAQKKLP